MSDFAPLVQERVATLGEVPGLVDFVFLDQPAIDEEAWAKTLATDPEALSILSMAIDAYGGRVDSWTHDELHVATLAVADGVGRKLGKAQAPIRVAVTGSGSAFPCSNRWRCWDPSGPSSACRPPAGRWRPVGRDRRPAGGPPGGAPNPVSRSGPAVRVGPFGLVLRVVAVVVTVVLGYLAVTAVQVWVTGRRYEPQSRRRHRGDGRSPVRRRALAGSGRAS